MTDRPRPLPGDRTPDNLAAIFRDFARFETPQLDAPLYTALCNDIANDPDLLDIAAAVPVSQPPPNMLLGAVHHLLLDGRSHPLRDFYPDLGGRNDPAAAFRHFREFVLDHRPEIEPLIRTRRVQTSVIQRCVCLLPAFACVAARAAEPLLALIEIGPSAGLNLLWDRYHYTYPSLPSATEPVRSERQSKPVLSLSKGGRTAHAQRPIHWGDPASPVPLTTELRGSTPLPPLPNSLPIDWRAGLELHPVDLADPDDVRWLRALIWPDHVHRHQRLAAAIEIARRDPPRIVLGDATRDLAPLLAEAPRDAALCVYVTMALYQIDRAGRRRIYDAIAAASAGRVVWFIPMESTGVDYCELFLHRYENGDRTTTNLANCNPHGRWLEWLAPETSR